jgi:hypothetical protein
MIERHSQRNARATIVAYDVERAKPKRFAKRITSNALVRLQ